MPAFPSNDVLKTLRRKCTANNSEKPIKCQHCPQTWSYDDLQVSYLKDWVKVPLYSSVEYEPKVKRLKTLAIEYQKTTDQNATHNYVTDFGYNFHCHTDSCFKAYKGQQRNDIISKQKNECRYRYPQKKNEKTIIQNVSITKLPWFLWNGKHEERFIKELCLQREEYDVFQNVYCPAISYSKLTCNTNIAFLMSGPIGQYCFHYSIKGTQQTDTKPYEEIKVFMEKVLSEIKHDQSNHMEAIRRLLSSSFRHQAKDTIKAPLAAYLTRNKSRFIFSHDFCWCPLRSLKSLIKEEEVSVTISF